MKITLTDKDGIKYDIDTIMIDEVHRNSEGRTEIILSSKEKLECKESASLVMLKIIEGKFGGLMK